MKITSTLTLLILLLAKTLLGGEVYPFMDLSFDQALKRAVEEETLVLAKFHADWCHWCNKMDRSTFSEPDVQTLLRSFVPIRVDVEEEGGLHLARLTGIGSLPTIVFYNGSGEVVGEYVGYRSADEMLKIMHYLRKKYARGE
ncbi:MAG: thioredoxin family protein [Fidelibacterota bacterium]